MKKRFSKIYVEITNMCNLNCSFCSKDNIPKKEMSVDEFNIVISKVKEHTNNIYLHVKGEPLLHSKLDELLNICDKNNINVRITTNGTLLEKNKDILLKHNIKQINVSLHSANNSSNYFNDVFNVCNLLSKTITVVYRIWTLKSLELDKYSTVIVDKIINHYNLSTEIVDKIKTQKNVKLSDNLYIDKDLEFKWPKITEKKSGYGTCLGTKNHIAILSNGNVTPCCLDSSGIITFGNIFKDSMQDILGSKLFKEINSGFKNRKVIHDLCKSCTYKDRFIKQ